MLSVVVNPFFDWGHDRPPKHEYHNTIIYEAHLKGMTALHPDIPEDLRGTYMGMAHPAMVNYLKDLGITAVELMPIHQFVNDTSLQDKGLSNYWGYNTIGFSPAKYLFIFWRGRLAGRRVQGDGQGIPCG